jgi:GNAT superfamily N-acetyltransferase
LTYTIGLERGDLNYSELEQNYRRHYTEMAERLEKDGIPVSPYNPRLESYFNAFRGGWLLNYVARFNGQAVGHCNVYLTNDMHNGDLIAQEDVLYVVPEHRNGLGKKLVRHVLSDLEGRGVKRVSVLALTDLRVAKIWRRMGFKDAAQMMTYTF